MNTTFAENGLSSHSFFDESHYVTLAIISLLVSDILGLPLNSYVIWLILAGARETLASDFFSLNLAMCEIFFSLSSIWYFVYEWLKIFSCFEAFVFSRGLFYTARPLFQCCICVECYLGVVHPMLFLQFKPLRYRVACCCILWPITLVSCLYCRYTYSDPLYLYMFFVQNLLFFSVMLFCCFSVLWALKRPGPGEKATEKKRKKKKHNTMKRRAFKIILFVTISMAINFFFYVASIPLQCCLKTVDFINALTISSIFALTTGFLQPLLYLHRNGKLFCFKEL